MADTGSTSHEQLLSEYNELWHGDFSKLETAAEDILVRDPAVPGGTVQGRDALEERIRGILHAFPDFHTEVEDQLESDGTVMMEWTMTGTHEGEYDGVPPTNREMEVSGMSKVVVADGKVQQDLLYFSPQEMLSQLGLLEE